MDDIKVSVICVTYNQVKYIRQCLDSLISQHTNYNYEILIHDDASTDGTTEIVREFENRYKNVRAVYEEQNQYSKGVKIDMDLIEMAMGCYFAFCEGDDYWYDMNKLQKQVDALEKNSNCTICAHRVRKVSRDGIETGGGFEQKSFKAGIIDGEKYLRAYLEGKNDLLLQTSCFLIRAEYVKEKPAELLSFGVGDVPMLIWALHNGDMYYFDETMSSYRVMSEGSTNEAMASNNYALDRVIKNAEGFLAFDRLTNGVYWDSLKHRVSYYIVQGYYGSRKNVFKSYIKAARKETGLKAVITAKIKYTPLGEIIRNKKNMIGKA